MQYADYAAWQRAWLTGEVLERQLAYWKAHLAGAPAALELPTDRPRPAVQSHRGGRRRFDAARGAPAARSATLARREGATLFMVLLAAFDVLLYRLRGQARPRGGLAHRGPHAGRDGGPGRPLPQHAGAARAGSTTRSPSRRSSRGCGRPASARTRTRICPSSGWCRSSRSARDLSRTPVFQVVLNAAERAAARAPRLPGLTAARRGRRHRDDEVRPHAHPRRRGRAGIAGTLLVPHGPLRRGDDGADGGPPPHRCSRASPRTRRGRSGELPLLGAEERRRLIEAWNEAKAGRDVDACVHALFEAQAERTPGALALVAGAERLTFAELDARANRLAHRLRRTGRRPRRGGRAVHGPDGGPDRRPARASSRRGARTCRSIPRCRGRGSGSCSTRRACWAS